MMGTNQVWQPEHYDNKLGFVSEYGKGVVDLLKPQRDEVILDLGCGTGDLSNEIAGTGAKVVGMDFSAQMIEQARYKYPGLNFKVGNGERFELDMPVDAVFSNAALHWMKDAPSVIRSVWNALRPGGRFVAEFGGKGNVEIIISSIVQALHEKYGIDAESLDPWYFPSVGDYSALLEQQGFRVQYVTHFDRFTKLEDREKGLSHWINGFAADTYFAGLGDQEKQTILHQVEQLTRPKLFINDAWHADYVRLRFIAIKPLS
ncbi:Malonyl-[acyl-carrier protein] O-methyltransferase [compost metagenome]